MSVYDDARAAALAVFTDPDLKQTAFKYRTYAAPAGATPDDPGTPVATDVVVNATARPVSTKYVDGTNIVQTDVQITVVNDGSAVPTMEGFMLINDVEHKIVALMAKSVTDPVVWTLIVRR